MNTKESILRKHLSGFELFALTPRDEQEMIMDSIYSAMQEYKEQQPIQEPLSADEQVKAIAHILNNYGSSQWHVGYRQALKDTGVSRKIDVSQLASSIDGEAMPAADFKDI